MAVGQQVLSGVASLELLQAAEEAVGACVPVDGQAHVDKLRAVLTLHRLYAEEGQALSTIPEAARLLRCAPADTDDLGQQLTDGSTRWTLDLDDPYTWTNSPRGG